MSRKLFTTIVRSSTEHVGIVVSAGLLLLFLSIHSSAQTTQTTTDKMTPSGITPGAPAGSYPLTGMESINLFNGNLDFHLPLLALDGRGSAVRNMMLSLNTKKWRVRESHTETSDTYTPTTTNWGSVDVGYLAGKLQGRQSGWSSRTCTNPKQTRYYYTNTKLTFVAPDGTEYDLRDQLTDGQPMVANQCGGIQGASRGTIFKTSDGSGVTFVSDSTIYDKTSIPTGQAGSWNLILSGYLLLRDGTRYRIDSGGVSWIRDRNGNLVYSQTDAINRQITMTTLPDGSDQITYPGYQGALRTITITHTNLGSALRAGYSLQTHAQLFPELLGGYNLGTYDPTVVSSVILPDGRSYQFRYNSYGELAHVVLPTGGAIEYDMTAGSGVVEGSSSYGLAYQIYRRVIERRTYVDGTTLEGRTTYSSDGSSTSVSHYDAVGTLLGREIHSFYGDAAASLFAPVEGGFYSDWHEGKEYSISYRAADGTTVLKTVTNTWEQRAAVAWYPTQYYNAGNEPANDPRITQTVTTLVDTNQVSKTTFIYDQYNNQTDSYEYDYGAGAAGALVRHNHTDYVTVNPVNGVDYTATGIYLRNLPSQTSVYDAGGVERARTTFEYDNYAADGNHGPLTDRPSISGHDSGFTTGYATRGNLTSSTSYLLTSGVVTGSITTYSQFDIAGNLIKAIDGRGYATMIDYTDRFGVPDGDARSNTAPSELSGLSSYAFPTQVTNALGQSVYGQYDYYLGRPVDGEDLNGVVASGYYNDVLDRPTQVRRAVGTTVASQSTFSYDDPNHTITVTSDLNTNNDNALVSKTLYDGLGRTTETRQYEGGTNYIATQQQYDGLGRAYKSSNPFRQNESPVWTTTSFDGLGRVTSVTTPDSAVVTTSYLGNSVTVTDQAGKARKSVTDALGRLTDVYEDPSGVAYQTTYMYDVLDDLVRVTQGNQQRFFMYDSLKRLIRAHIPEQDALAALNLYDPITNHSNWASSYEYDSNSNLTSRTDARAVVTQNSYDALNRVTTILYRINGQQDPNTGDVQFLYDNAAYGKGRLWLTYKWGAQPSHTAVGFYDALGRVKQFYNLFGDGQGGWLPAYEINRTYNLAGNVTSQTYPSGRTVSYSYDAADRTTSFTGNLGDGTQRTYATAIQYSPFGGIKKEQFRTQQPLYHHQAYNIRGQVYYIAMGPNNDDWGGDYGKLIYYYGNPYCFGCSGAENNGNVRLIDYYLPGGYLIHDHYYYDSLNRLVDHMEEDTAQQFRQHYSYDRYGNRTIDQTLSWGNINKKAFTVTEANNRLGVPTGQSGSMDYDAAGNLINDTYTGAGSRTYDAENRIVSAVGWSNQTQFYTYNAAGQRVRRKVDGVETWQMYGIDGELVAEYAANATPTSPQKEYGYRNGQLLITAETGPKIQWLVADHLGTPRMVFDQTGSLANVKRHDYLPFGEELLAGTGGRTSGLGYAPGDGVRQQFTQKERDIETGLDYFGARYYASTEGRFTSPDPMNSSGIPMLPQTWNRYSYTINNPLLYTDQKGLIWGYHDHDGIRTFTWYDDEDALKTAGDTPYTQSQYFSNQAGTDAVYLGSNGNARHISQDEFATGVLDEYLRGPESPLNDKEKGDLQRKFALRVKAEHPEWNFWAALFGGLAGGLAEGAESGAGVAAGSEIDAEALTLSKTVESHLDDITKLGTKARPYGDSRLVMKEIMEAGKPVPDPGGVPGGLRWDVPGAVNGSKGTWELVIDPKTSTVLHFVFKSAPKQ